MRYVLGTGYVENRVFGRGRGVLGERDHLENLRVDGRRILEWIFKKQHGRAWIGLDWIGLMRLRTRKRWRAVMNRVVELWVQ
jgi:hypothetical protein